MPKILRAITLVILSLVVVAGGVVIGCGDDEEELVEPSIGIYRIAKGVTSDFDDATVNSMAGPGGQSGFLYGQAAARWPDEFDDDALQAMTVQLVEAGRFKLSSASEGTYRGWTDYAYEGHAEGHNLEGGDKQTVQSEIFYTVLTEEERAAVYDIVTSYMDMIADGVEASQLPEDDPDYKSLEENLAYGLLNSSVSPLAAKGWKAAVEAGAHSGQAFYQWMAKEPVLGMAAAAPLIRLSSTELALKVTNPNSDMISLDSLQITMEIDGAVMARMALADKIWVPAEGEIIIHQNVPIKFTDCIGDMFMAGMSATEAMAALEPIWAKMMDGTATWDVTCEATISSEVGTINKIYTLPSWTLPES